MGVSSGETEVRGMWVLPRARHRMRGKWVLKHRAFFKTLTFFISANSEDIVLKFVPDTYDHKLMLQKDAVIYNKLSQIIFHYFFIDTSRNTLSDTRHL